jgi:putative SOS response-associated peptidase YedK
LASRAKSGSGVAEEFQGCWTGASGARQPWLITAADGTPLSLAGLWEPFRDPASGERALSATIIVTDANPFMARLHHRMPVILRGGPRITDHWIGWIAAKEERSRDGQENEILG